MQIVQYRDLGYPTVERVFVVHKGREYYIPIMPRAKFRRLGKLIAVGNSTGKYGQAWQIVRKYAEKY